MLSLLLNVSCVFLLLTEGYLPVGKRKVVKGSFGKDGKGEGY